MRSVLFLAAILSVAAPPVALASPPAVVDPTGVEGHAFNALHGRWPDLTADAFLASLPAAPATPALGFDVAAARFYDLVLKAIPLTAPQRAALARQGLVVAPQDQRFSMGSAYHYLYSHDLPVFVSADSVLHAWHRSFDTMLARLESEVFASLIYEILWAARDHLVAQSKAPWATGDARTALYDAELYFTVALNLVRGSTVVSAFGQGEALQAVLDKIKAQAMDTAPTTALYGGRRVVDWTQFQPRGHYTLSASLQQYFRAMMWLGRADTGFSLVDGAAGSEVDVARERRAAQAVTWALAHEGGLDRLAALRAVIDALIGSGDELSPEALLALSKGAGVKGLHGLTDGPAQAALLTQIKASGGGAQRILSQLVTSFPGLPQVAPPAVFQLFGQRFLIDSFVLSKVVYDTIMKDGTKVERFMPMGLDVMAALGNDEAARLLADELARWHYAPNLKTLRALIEAYPASKWQAGTVYDRWLGVLRTLNAPLAGRFVPKAMQGEAWRRKTLRTQLASWAELRHDTILYGKQSFTAVAGCEYPAGYVEPVPPFYAAMATLAEGMAGVLADADLKSTRQPELVNLLDNQQRFLKAFAGTVRRLERLATLELAGKPFPAADVTWIKQTIDKRGGGSGPPRYDGWYPTLFWGAAPDDYVPEVADVHTDPNSGRFLEVATGDVELLVIAVDSGADHAVYVGPVSSYYEFSAEGTRLTDEAWRWQIRDGKAPAPPAWAAPLF